MKSPIILVENLYSLFGADDAAYLICPKKNKKIYFITDGHSQREGSADLVSKFKNFITNSFDIASVTEENIEEKVNQVLLDFHESVKRILPRAAMCLILAIKIDSILHVFHLGDCRLGRFFNNRIEWLTKPHLVVLHDQPDMTEEELRLNESNHVVYKLFRINRSPCKLDYLRYESNNIEYILATDGFWKLVQEKQMLLLNGKFPKLSDDVAFIRFTI